MSTPEIVEAPTRRQCATQAVHRRLLTESEDYRRARDEIENLALDFASGRRRSMRTEIVRIPLVFHVVYNTATQNVSDAQIDTQIVVLNQDFRRTNPDIAQVPAVWQGITADARIEFHRATQDPDGNATNGVTRTQTSTPAFTDDDAVKFAAQGGADAWPSDRYLNVWVCQLAGGLLGYAQFPGGPAATDGVVITHTGFGTTGTAAPPFDRGRTATHEIGHWLDLYHIWGDDGTGCSGSDQVADTPNQAGFNVGCPTFPSVTCNNGPNGDMWMNYMDYTDDACMYMFTQGQVERIEACLAGPRSSFLPKAAARPVASPTFAVAWGPGRLDVVGRGIDSGLHHQAWDGSQWVPGGGAWEGLGGLFSSEPRIVAWGPGRLDVLGLGTDSGMYHKAWDGSQWVPGGGGWEGLGGLFVSPPAVVAWDSGRLDVFGLGTDNGMYHKAWDGSQWVPGGGGWEGLGGIFTRAPAVAAWGPNRLDVFGIGLDSGMYHQAWDGSQWVPGGGAWEGLGGLFVSPPAVAAWDAGRLDVFGLGTDSGMYHKAWDGTQWVPGGGAWEGLGGTFRSPPAVVAWDANRLDVFGLGLDNAMYHKAWDGSQWVPAGGNWERLGGIFQSQPAVVAWAPGRLDVFGLGLDFAMYHKAWDGSQWVPGGDAWERLGGIFSAP